MNCLLSMGRVNNLATAWTFGPHAGVTASRFIVDDRVLFSNCLATERAVATDRLWVIRSHSHEFTAILWGEGACDTVLKLVRLLKPTQRCSLSSKFETL